MKSESHDKFYHTDFDSAMREPKAELDYSESRPNKLNFNFSPRNEKAFELVSLGEKETQNLIRKLEVIEAGLAPIRRSLEDYWRAQARMKNQVTKRSIGIESHEALKNSLFNVLVQLKDLYNSK